MISLGTNDGSDPRRFADRLGRALAAIPESSCVVWADIYRPPRKGAFAALNRVLRDAVHADRRLALVHWDRAVAGRGSRCLPTGCTPTRTASPTAAGSWRRRSDAAAADVRRTHMPRRQDSNLRPSV